MVAAQAAAVITATIDSNYFACHSKCHQTDSNLESDVEIGAHHIPTVPSPLLGRILGDLRAAGVRPSPLSILCKATDDGLTDADVSVLVDELAASPRLAEVV